MGMKRLVAGMMLALFLVSFAGCVIKNHVPPGQIKKQSAPGQVKKHR